MKQHYFALATAFVVAACAPAAQVAIAHDDPLTATIAELDREVFDAFNRCDEAGQLERHEKFFDENVEFYHDTGGVTWTRDEMIASTAKKCLRQIHTPARRGIAAGLSGEGFRCD